MKKWMSLLLTAFMLTTILGMLPVQAANGIVVNLSSPGFAKEGDWKIGASGLGFEGSDTGYSTAAGTTATWYPNLTKAAKVKVSFWVITNKEKPEETDKDMKFLIVTNGKTEEAHLDTSKFTQNGWAELGTFDFAGKGMEEYVKFVKNTPAGWGDCSRINAVKFEAADGSALSQGEYQARAPEPSQAPQDVTTSQEIGANALILNHDSPGVWFDGDWQISTGGFGYQGASNKWTTTAPASALFFPDINKPTKVNIKVWAIFVESKPKENDTNMEFTITYGGGKQEKKYIDCTKIGKSGWMDLGTYDFTGDEKEFVTFNKITPNGFANCSRMGQVAFLAADGSKLSQGSKASVRPEEPSSTLTEGPILVKVGDKGYTEAGPWAALEVKEGEEPAKIAAVANAVVAFHPNIVSSGEIKISYYSAAEEQFDRKPDSQASFEIVHQGKTETVTADQSQKNGWVELGTFAFDGTQDEYVKLTRTSADKTTYTRASTLKFEPVGNGVEVGLKAPEKPKGIEYQPAPADQEGLLDENKIYDYDYEYAVYSPEEDSILTQDDPGYSETGEWAASSLVGYQGAKSRYSFTPNAAATFKPSNLKEGLARVSFFKLVHPNSDTRAKIEVVHNGKTDTMFLDQTTGEAGWVDLGIFDFAGDGNEYVRVSNAETFATCRTNAVKFDTSISTVQVDGDRSVIAVDGEKLDQALRLSLQGTKKVEIPFTAEVGVKATKKNVTFTLDADTVNRVKQTADDAALTFAVQGVKLALPIRELEAGKGASVTINKLDSAEIKAQLQQNGTPLKSELLDIQVVQEGKTQFRAPIEVTFDTETTSLTDSAVINCEDFSYVPAYIDGTGDFGVRLHAQASLNTNAVIALVEGVQTFADLSGHWAKADVEQVAGKYLVKGKGDGYAPEDSITRAEFVTLLVRGVGAPLTSDGLSYSDVPSGEWYAPYIGAAQQAGLLELLPYGSEFGPDTAITRQEMAVMVLNGIKAAGKYKNTLVDASFYLDQFSDQSAIADWAKEPVARAVENGIIAGIEKDGILTFSPDENSTRAQAAVMLKRFIDLPKYVGPLAEGEWEMVFEDEFEGDDLDWNMWESQNGYPAHIRSSRYKENIKVEDGKVKLIARKEDKGGTDWTTGNIWTKEFTTTYGYFEASYKYPDSVASQYNIAFWLMKNPADMEPHYQEIDINEGRNPNIIQTGLHGSIDGTRWSRYEKPAFPYDLTKEYHTYALEWTPEVLIWYFDGKEIRREKNEGTDQPVQVYLSTAIMKEAIDAELDKDVDGSSMDVEYVRVYKRK